MVCKCDVVELAFGGEMGLRLPALMHRFKFACLAFPLSSLKFTFY
jgi:hypothetical protein